MSIDRQRVAAVAALETLGWVWNGGSWVSPVQGEFAMLELIKSADALHGLAMRRANALAGAAADSGEAAELEPMSAAIEAYEVARWPLGKAPGRKG